MWPLGTYDRFLRKIKGQEFSQEKANYFGVLFCDVRQTNAREYVLNYLDVFNKKSGKFIDFYIPGYIPSDEYYGLQNCNAIHIGKQKYFSIKANISSSVIVLNMILALLFHSQQHLYYWNILQVTFQMHAK